MVEPLKASQSNNSLTAQDHSETKLATVDLWTTLSSTSRPTEFFTKMNILTRLLNKPAQRTLETSRLVDLLTLKTATTSPQALLQDLFQLPLMPPTGHPTRAEFSITARLPSTTVSYLSELVINSGELKTLGEPLGESLDSSDLPEETLAVSATLLHIPPNDFDNQINPLFLLIIFS